MTDPNLTTNDPWEPCASGELQRLAQTIRTKRTRTYRREFVKTAAAVVAAVASIVLVAIYTRNLMHPAIPAGEKFYAGISCTDVRKTMSEMMSGKVEEARVAQIQDHLRQCQACREVLERMDRPMSRSPVEHHRRGPVKERPMLAYLEWSAPPR